MTWLWSMPPTWELCSPKALFEERRTPNLPGDVHLTPSQKYGVLPQAEYMERTGGAVVLNLTGQNSMKHVEPDDFIIHLRSFQGGLERARQAGKVSTAYTVVKPRVAANPGFYRWLLKSSGFIQELQTTTNQLRDGQSIRWTDFVKVRLPVPPLGEQRAIADYLDRETQKIDELIDEQRGLIETLKERRRSVVSKTLDGTTNSVKLKYILSRGRPLTYGIVQAGPPVDEGVPYIGPSDIVNHQVVGLRELRKTSPMVEMAYKRSRVQRGDVVVSIGPAYGKTTMIPVELAGANLTQDTARVSCDAAKASPRYVQWVLMSDSAHEFWNSRIMGATFRRLNLDVLAQTPIPLPSIGEQCDIAAYLDEQTSRIDVLISESEDLIALSEERRSALITAAVTGQIDVRKA